MSARGNSRAGALRRALVPSLFGIAAVVSVASALRGIEHAVADPGTRAALLAGYDVLRAGVALAFAICTIGRSQPRRRTREPLAYVACAAAMASVLLFSAPDASTPEGVVLAGEVVTLLAYVWLLYAVLTLGRCFGVLPEARGLVRAGPYAVVRHPVYLGEIGACAGLVLAAPGAGNAAVLAAVVAAQAIRMRLEERALAEAFPDYASYALSTPRILPLRAAIRLARNGASRPSVRTRAAAVERT